LQGKRMAINFQPREILSGLLRPLLIGPTPSGEEEFFFLSRQFLPGSGG